MNVYKVEADFAYGAFNSIPATTIVQNRNDGVRRSASRVPPVGSLLHWKMPGAGQRCCRSIASAL